MEVTIDQFIKSFNIKPADAIKMKKKSFGMLDHYVLYLGVHNNHHKFIANYTKGVDVIPENEIMALVQVLQPTAVEPFPGNEYQRQFAIQRAFSRMGENAYGLITNNCEHFKNYVHHGEDSSKQVETFGGRIAVAGFAATLIGISKKDPLIAFAGFFAACLGMYIYHTEKKPDDNDGFQPYKLL